MTQTPSDTIDNAEHQRATREKGPSHFEAVRNDSTTTLSAGRKAMLALSTAAMNLPGMGVGNALAATADEDTRVGYRFSSYTEDAIDPAKLANISPDVTERYSITVHQIHAKTPVSKDTELFIDLVSESMSGASPWYVIPDAQNRPVQVMSGATIEESRNDISVGFTSYGESSQTTTSASYSKENDYDSLSISSKHSTDFNEGMSTFSVGFSASKDFISATDADIFISRPENESKVNVNATAGITQVVTKSILLSSSISYGVFEGYLSDMYKQAWVNGSIVHDSRPDTRRQFSWTTQYRQYFDMTKGALHADYRMFTNDWDVNSHTVEFSYFQNIGTFQVVPKIRFYTQSGAIFYRPFYTQARSDGFYSSDFRLSAFTSSSFQLKGSKFFDFGAAHLSFETYTTNPTGDLPENPALLSFTRFTLGFDYKFD